MDCFIGEAISGLLKPPFVGVRNLTDWFSMNRLKNRFGSCLWNSLQLVKFGAVIFFSTGNKSLCYFDNSQCFHYPPKSAIPFRGRQLACQVKIPPDPFRSRWSPLIERNLRGHSLLITLADPPARTLSIVANPIVQTWGEALAQGKELVFLQRSRSKTFYHEFQFDWHLSPDAMDPFDHGRVCSEWPSLEQRWRSTAKSRKLCHPLATKCQPRGGHFS